MAGEISRFMAEYSAVKTQAKAPPSEDLSSRRRRRKAVSEMALQMGRVLDAETRSHDNVPENLRGASAYEDDEERISVIEEAVELLSSIY
jgi:hypothetical protein